MCNFRLLESNVLICDVFISHQLQNCITTMRSHNTYRIMGSLKRLKNILLRIKTYIT